MFIRAKINHINQTLSEEAWKNLTIGLKSLLREIFECKYQIMGQELTRIYKFVLATYVILVINLPDNILFSCGNILFSCVENWKSYWIFPVGTEVSAILQFTYQTFFLFFLYYIPFSASWFLFIQMFRFVARLLRDGQLFSWWKRRLLVVFWAENIKWNLKMMASEKTKTKKKLKTSSRTGV